MIVIFRKIDDLWQKSECLSTTRDLFSCITAKLQFSTRYILLRIDIAIEGIENQVSSFTSKYKLWKLKLQNTLNSTKSCNALLTCTQFLWFSVPESLVHICGLSKNPEFPFSHLQARLLSNAGISENKVRHVKLLVVRPASSTVRPTSWMSLGNINIIDTEQGGLCPDVSVVD